MQQAPDLWFIVDHDELRRNYAEFKKRLPRVQAYYAVKANPDPAIVRTLYEEGASFDVADSPVGERSSSDQVCSR